MDTKFNLKQRINPIYNAFYKPYQFCLDIQKVPKMLRSN